MRIEPNVAKLVGDYQCQGFHYNLINNKILDTSSMHI